MRYASAMEAWVLSEELLPELHWNTHLACMQKLAQAMQQPSEEERRKATENFQMTQEMFEKALDQALNMLKQMQQLNYHPKAIIFFRAGGDPSWANLGALGDYIIGSSEWDPNLNPNDAKVKELIAAWQNKGGKIVLVLNVPPITSLEEAVMAGH